ncbi:hypothetical protein B0H10DRAFT_1944822 [Mycena sp. CBHHK59/15]|nr:hypothetical protein B0H10DRAFT_1944822 [Mycena sp. CBHHK59/15]
MKDVGFTAFRAHVGIAVQSRSPSAAARWRYLEFAPSGERRKVHVDDGAKAWETTLPFMDNEPEVIEVPQAVPRLMAHHLKVPRPHLAAALALEQIRNPQKRPNHRRNLPYMLARLQTCVDQMRITVDRGIHSVPTTIHSDPQLIYICPHRL